MPKLYKVLKNRGFAYLWCQFKNLFDINKDIIALISLDGAYKYLQRYQYICKQAKINSIDDDTNPYPNKIWCCWLQGIENAPFTVQQCIGSIQKHAGDQEVIILTLENMDQYIQLPEYIIKKWKEKIISNTHFSDLIRITLLYQYGGLWIDSTTWLTGAIPDYIKKTDLFCYRGSGLGKVIASNWLIAAKPHHPIIQSTKELLYEYWKKENKLISYSIFHLFFTMAIKSVRSNQKLWEEVPWFDDSNPKRMQNELFAPFDPERFKQICQLSSIHKLSYKYTKEQYNAIGTLYDFIIKKGYELPDINKQI